MKTGFFCIKKPIFVLLFMVAIVAAIFVGRTIALYSDFELSNQNSFTAGVIDLEVANTNETSSNPTEGNNLIWDFGKAIGNFFNFSNVKPSDFGSDTIGLRVKTNPAWMCMRISNIRSTDQIDTKAELLDDSNASKGELDEEISFVFWNDSNKNNAVDNNETILYDGKIGSDLYFPIADSKKNLFGMVGNPLVPNNIYSIQKAWCLGEWNKNVTPWACDGTMLNNRTQGDQFLADVEFLAIQERHNQDFVCPETTITYKYYNCDRTNYSCSITAGYSSRQECQTKTGGDCYYTSQNCIDNCKEPTYKYYTCSTSTYTCGITPEYKSKEACQTANPGQVCYDTQDICTTNCQKPKYKYYSCNSDCYTCDQTTIGYESLSDCQTKTGNTCYESTSTCSANCKAPAITTRTYDTLSGITGDVEAIAQWGNGYPYSDRSGSNEWRNSPSEFLLKQSGTTKDSEEHSPWAAYNYYDFVIERTADGTINFNVTSTDATNKLLTFKPVVSMGSKLILEIIAPKCGFSEAIIYSYKKDICQTPRDLNASIMINNWANPCVCDTKYKRVEITGLDFSKPFKIYGKFKWGWVVGTSDLSTSTPSMTVKFK